MNTFITLRTGQGEGCDHTIACNKDYKIEKSELDLESYAQQKVLDSFFGGDDPDEYGKLYSDDILDEMIIIHLEEGIKFEVDIGKWVKHYQDYFDKKKEEEQTRLELETLERLRKKHNK